jgi:predicted 3-demethylubiquinone-9 3-methyltransferase (glyoxalase superfamily)
MQNITTCLWFDGQAEEAVNFYLSVIKNSEILHVSRYQDTGAEASDMQKGTVMTVTFRLNGRDFMALNGGPVFKFTPAISFMIYCDTQTEIDNLWDKLSDGGEKSQCGWLKDKYGVSWQIVPAILEKFMTDEDPVKSKRVMDALLKMNKLDIKILQQAFEQK